MKLNHKTGTVSLKYRMLAVSIVVVMILSAFGMMMSSTVVAAEVGNEVSSIEPLALNEDFQDYFEVKGPWLTGNIAVDDGTIPESVTIMFSNLRTEENAVEIASNGTYRFSLQNFTQGYEVGDGIYMEAVENTGNGKINAGNTTVIITDAEEMWSDIMLIDPPPFELVPPNAVSELPDKTPEEPDVPSPTEEEPWIKLVSLRIQPGYRYALADEKVKVEVTLQNVGSDAIVRATLTNVKPDGSEETIGNIHYGRLKTTWEQTKHINWWPDQVGRNWIRIEIGVKGQGNEYTIVGEHLESLWVAPSDNVVVWENKVIDTPSHYEDMTIIVLGGLRISAPTTFVNVTKIFDITTYDVDVPTWETNSWVIFDTGPTVTAYLSVNAPSGELYLEQNSYVTAGDTDYGYDFYVHNLLDVSTNSQIDYHQNGIQLLSDTVSSTFSTNAVIKDGHDYGIIATGLAPLTITDTTLFRNYLDGIYIQGPSPTITGGTFSLNGGDGIHVVGGSPMIDGVQTISNNGGDGIHVVGGSPTISGVQTISNNGGDGIHIVGGSPTITGTLAAPEYIESNGGYGIYIDGGTPIIQDIDHLGSFGNGNALGGIRVKNNANPTIQGNVISYNSGDGISIYQATGTIENNLISDHSTGAGIRVVYSSAPVTIQTNPAYSATTQQIYGNKYGVYMVNSDGAINGNYFHDTNFGVYSTGISSPVINGNTFDNNNIGIGFLSGSSTGSCENNLISVTGDNTGIYIENTNPSPTIQNGNILTGIAGGLNTRVGIWSILSSPLISGNTIDNFYYGIYNDQGSPFIGDNAITGDTSQNSVGIYFTGPSSSTIFRNTIQYNPAYGIYSDGQSLFIEGNTIINNGYGIYMANAQASPIDNIHATFDTSPDGFAVEADIPDSEVRWDNWNGNVYFYSNRHSPKNEMFTRNLQNPITDADGDWELSARMMITYKTILSYTFPLFISDSGNTMVESPNSIYFYWYHGNPGGIPDIDNSIGARYYDASGVERTLFVREHLSLNTEYQLRTTYKGNTLTMYIMDNQNTILGSGSYVIGSNPGDGFTLGKLGVSSDGTGHLDSIYKVTGWTDDINFGGPEIQRNTISSNNLVGIELNASSPDIYDNTIDSNFYVGIGVYGNSKPIIDSNTVSRTPSATGFTFKGMDIGSASAPLITNNDIEDQGIGVFTIDSLPTATNNLYIERNGFGIYSENSTISVGNNIFTDTLNYGFYLYDSSGSIYGNQIIGATTGIKVSSSLDMKITDNIISTKHGIFVYHSTALIRNNIITVTGDINPETGIMTGGGPVVISGNTLTGSGRGRGIFVGNIAFSYSDVIIKDNRVNGFDYGIELRASSTSTLDNNAFYSNNFDGIYTGGPMDKYGSQPVYTINNCEIYDNGGWGMNFISNAPTNADTLEIDNPLLGTNGIGKIHQEWKIVWIQGVIYGSVPTPMHATITDQYGTIIFDEDVLYGGPTTIPVVEYELYNTGPRNWYTPHTVDAISLGEYYSSPVSTLETMDRNRNLFVIFDIVEDTFTILAPHPVPGFPAKNYISFPLLNPKVAGQPLNNVEDLWNEIVTAGGVPQQIRVWEPNSGWLSYTPGDPLFDIIPDYAYEITHNQPFGLTITGYLPGYRQMDLFTGTNYIGWTTHHTEITVSTFGTLIDPQNLNLMRRWDTGNQQWVVMSPSDFIYPGKAYWVDVTGDCTLAYNEAGLIDEIP